MTPEERVDGILRDVIEHFPRKHLIWEIERAIAEEREACAQIAAEAFERDLIHMGNGYREADPDQIATAIRART
jgi:hypothetical protein